MFLGCGFEQRLHIKTRWKDGPLDGKKVKAAKWGKPHQKVIKTKKIYKT